MSDGKMLYLMRHAEASWPDSAQTDFERPLAQQGERDAALMGKRIKTRGIYPDLILSSPALRAAKTAQHIATEIGIPMDQIFFHDSIYEASVSHLFKIIQTLSDHHNSAILIGHNPSLSEFINRLSGEHINAPTCSMATLQTFSPRWEDTTFGTTDLLDFNYP